MSTAQIISDWHNCYDDGWQGVIVPEAFAHPAKMAYGLLRRIIRHGLVNGYWTEGDTLGDPFGGVLTTGIVGAYHGLKVVAVELEPRFVDLANQNVSLHRQRWQLSGDPEPVIIQGDSRRFAELVGSVAGVVSSPPWTDTLASSSPTNRVNEFRVVRTVAPDKTAIADYIREKRSLSGLSCKAVCEVGGFHGAVNHGGACANWESGLSLPTPAQWLRLKSILGLDERFDGPMLDTVTVPVAERFEPDHDTTGLLRETYGQTPGQIGALPAGNLDGVISSPPYAANEKCDYRIKDENGQDRDQRRGYRQGEGSFRGSETYGVSDGQIGALKEGVLDGAVTSPPFMSIVPGSNEREAMRNANLAESRGEEWAIYSQDRPVDSTIGGDRTSAAATAAREERAKSAANIGCIVQTGNQGRLLNVETYWQAMAQVYAQMRLAVKPGGICAIVVKDYVKAKARVPLCDQTCTLLESLGFEVFERSRCWLVKSTSHPSLFGGNHVKIKERKSFFRRLAEKNGSPRIDYEEVIWCVRDDAPLLNGR